MNSFREDEMINSMRSNNEILPPSVSQHLNDISTNQITENTSNNIIYSFNRNTVTLIDADENSCLFNKQTRSDSPNNINEEELTTSRFSNYVYQVLNQSGEGNFLIQAYEFEKIESNRQLLLKKKKQTYFSVHKVSKILIFHEVHRTQSYSITPDRLDFLAENASKLFPTYLKDTFYSRSNSKNDAHGTLQMFYTKLREKAIAINIVKQSRSRKRKIVDDDENISEAFKDLQVQVSIIDDAYKLKWKNTALEEKKLFFSISDYDKIFRTLPVLLNPLGYTLIQEDFSSLFNKSSNTFEENWPIIAKKNIKIAKLKKDKAVKDILKDCKDSTDETDNNVALLLLPFLFKKITKLTKKSAFGRAWNPEKEEVLSSFVYHVKEKENITTILKEVNEKINLLHTEHKLILQPYVVIQGASINTITSAYVMIGNHTYQLTTPLKAIDLCFQCVKVFQKQFSHICTHVWQLLEREVFKFDVRNIHGVVSHVIDQLNQVQ